jgi:hypothetical protein
MQEFAPTKSRFSGKCPSDEELAAYIDSALDEREAARIAEHLVSCERCYEVYSETLRFLLDSKPAPTPNVVPFPRKKEGHPVTRWGSLAAILLVGIGAGTYFQLLREPPALVTSELTAPLKGKPGLTKKFWVGQTLRGGGDEEREDKPWSEASFQLGVQLVNLRVALEANDAGSAGGNIIPRIHKVLQTQVEVSSLEDSYKELSKDLQKMPSQDLLRKAGQLARDSRGDFEESYLDLGQWVEAGRLAALARDPSFFQQADTRNFLRRSIWRERLGLGETKLDPPSRRSLEQIGDIVSRGDLRTSDYAELGQRFDQILAAHYPNT